MGRKGLQRNSERPKFYEGLIQILAAYARYTFFWGGKQEGSEESKQTHIDSAKSNGLASLVITDQTKEQVDLSGPPFVKCPVELEYIWDWFIDLSRTRDNGMGVGSVSYAEIQAWSQLMKIDVQPFEVKCIRAIDFEFVAHHNKREKA